MVLQNRLVAGGAYLLIAPYNTSRNGIEQVIEQNVKPEFPSAYIVYKSREDGVEEEGLRMEQNFEENYVHPLVGRELFMLRKFDGSCITGQFDEIVKNTSIDVIFDSVNDKVYVAGQKMTAKQINSQMSAVEMIQLFFSKGKCIISNTELSRNTYSKDKNTMNSKIIYPLTKALLERTGKKFVLKASGSLHVFDIFLDPDSVNMGVLEKVI